MTKKQIEKLASNEEVFTWVDPDEGAVGVTVISESDIDNFYKVRRAAPKPNCWDIQEVPACKIFHTEEACERDCLSFEEEYNEYEEAFRPIESFLITLLVACGQGRKLGDVEFIAATNRVSEIIGTDVIDCILDANLEDDSL